MQATYLLCKPHTCCASHIPAVQATYLLCKPHTCCASHIPAVQATYLLCKPHTCCASHIHVPAVQATYLLCKPHTCCASHIPAVQATYLLCKPHTCCSDFDKLCLFQMLMHRHVIAFQPVRSSELSWEYLWIDYRVNLMSKENVKKISPAKMTLGKYGKCIQFRQSDWTKSNHVRVY